MYRRVPYNPTVEHLEMARYVLENFIPDDWPEVSGIILGEEAAPSLVFEPTPLVFGPGDPDCFWEAEGGIPFRGQEEAKRLIDLKVRALRPQERLKLLLVGPAGCGKTSLAWITAKRLIERRGGTFFELLPSQLSTLADLERFVRSLEEHSVVLIDEIHILAEMLGVEPLLHLLADTGRPRLKVGRREVRVPPSVSWIGATTDPGRMDRTTGGALRRRLDPILRLEAPDVDTLVQIVMDQAVPIDRDAAYDLAERSNGLPWKLLSLYRDCVSVARLEGSPTVTMHHAQRVFSMRRLDPNGLDAADRAVIRVLLRSPVQMAGGAVRYKLSEAALCAAAGVDETLYRTEIQPRLRRLGLLHTMGGQVLTERATAEYGWLAHDTDRPSP